MRYDDAAKVVLIRAIEEVLPDRIAPETLLEAHAAAGDPARGGPWIVKRAAYLVDHAVSAYRELLAPAEASLPGPWAYVAFAFVVGLASNYLGPAGRIHVVFNPIVLLVLWNLAVYAGLAVRWIVRERRGPAVDHVDTPARAAPRVAAAASTQPGLFERLALGRAYTWLLGTRSKVESGLEDAKDAARVASRFAVLSLPVMRPAFGLWLRRLLHLSAIGVAAGAIVGMYARGLFFAYHVVWRSTFVDDPGTVAFALALLLGPASLMLGRMPPGQDDVVRLLSDQGAPAAPWIHLYAATAALFILLPRIGLAVVTSRRLRHVADDVQLDLGAPYYADLLQRALDVSPARLEAGIRAAVGDECRLFAGRLAELVCVQLYDARIAPRLRAFREQGGSLRDLEASLRTENAAFGPVLTQELDSAMQELERTLAMRVRRLLGDDALRARPAGDLVQNVGTASSTAARHFGDRVGGDVATMVGSVVSASVAVAVGTVTGGFGEVLGIALLVGVLETGPLGWIVGALVGLVGTGAALWLGRDAIRDGVKTVRLPSRVVKLATLSAGRYERIIRDGRTKCGTAVRDALSGKLDELAGTIADQVWTRLAPVVGELRRPRVRVDSE